MPKIQFKFAACPLYNPYGPIMGDEQHSVCDIQNCIVVKIHEVNCVEGIMYLEKVRNGRRPRKVADD